MDGLNMLRSLTDMDQKAYPERLGKLFIVNSPYVFVKVYSMIKKWLDPGGKEQCLDQLSTPDPNRLIVSRTHHDLVFITNSH